MAEISLTVKTTFLQTLVSSNKSWRRSFSRGCRAGTVAVWTVCLLMSGWGELRAQLFPNLKPGAYHSKGRMVSYRYESPSFVSAIYPGEKPYPIGVGLVGLGLGLKIPVSKLKSQILPSVGMNLGLGISDANRLELSTEWRHFPLGHDRDEEYDWEKPWIGLGGNVGYRPATLGFFTPFHAGAFLKMGTGWAAFFAEYSLTPVLDPAIASDEYEYGLREELVRNARTIRYGFVFEF